MSTATTAATTELEALAARLDEAMSRIESADPESKKVTTDAVDALNALHKQGLITIVRRLREDPRGKELLFELVDDEVVHMLLSMHGIIRPDPMTLAQQALDRVRPGLVSHGGDVSLDSVRDGVAYVKLQGACNGCSMAAVTMREGVEAALVAGVPGVTSVEVLPNDPTPTVIPLSSIGIGPPGVDPLEELKASGWFEVSAARGLAVGGLCTARLGATEVIVVNAAGQLAAYINACAHEGRPLDDAIVDATAGTITCPWHGFCYDSTNGECLTMPGAQLEQLPLRVEAGRVLVRLSQ